MSNLWVAELNEKSGLVHILGAVNDGNVRGDGLGHIAIVEVYRREDADVCMFPRRDPEKEGFARLIAAAPDLLEALQQLLPQEWRDGVMDHMPGVKAARQAIARATGAKP